VAKAVVVHGRFVSNPDMYMQVGFKTLCVDLGFAVLAEVVIFLMRIGVCDTYIVKMGTIVDVSYWDVERSLR
jgi:hypothetical protein